LIGAVRCGVVATAAAVAGIPIEGWIPLSRYRCLARSRANVGRSMRRRKRPVGLSSGVSRAEAAIVHGAEIGSL
jgi:hypothetical protein